MKCNEEEVKTILKIARDGIVITRERYKSIADLAADWLDLVAEIKRLRAQSRKERALDEAATRAAEVTKQNILGSLMPVPYCANRTFLTCCDRWREVGLAFRDGRREEAVQEARRLLMIGEHAGCRVGARVVAQMKQEGYL